MSEELVEAVLGELERRGLRIKRPVTLQGASGYEYELKALVEDVRTGKSLAVAFVERVGPESVLPLLAHRIDLDVVEVVVTEHLDESSAELLRAAGMHVVEISRCDPAEGADLICELLKLQLGRGRRGQPGLSR